MRVGTVKFAAPAALAAGRIIQDPIKFHIVVFAPGCGNSILSDGKCYSCNTQQLEKASSV
jgi:hypothetical protein